MDWPQIILNLATLVTAIAGLVGVFRVQRKVDANTEVTERTAKTTNKIAEDVNGNHHAALAAIVAKDEKIDRLEELVVKATGASSGDRAPEKQP